MRASPARGTLVLDGGPEASEGVARRFVELAGGAKARIVLIPSASGDAFARDPATIASYRKLFGPGCCVVLHTTQRAMADRADFARKLENATGVWIVGGSPATLADTYWHTATERALRAVLDRGGVVGGSSTGAVIQASMIPTTHPDHGFGWLRNTFVMAHLNRNNARDLLVKVVAEHAAIIGIGIPEQTAAVVTGDQLEVIGSGDVVVADGRVQGVQPFTVVRPGGRVALLPRGFALAVRLRHMRLFHPSGWGREGGGVMSSMARCFPATMAKALLWRAASAFIGILVSCSPDNGVNEDQKLPVVNAVLISGQSTQSLTVKWAGTPDRGYPPDGPSASDVNLWITSTTGDSVAVIPTDSSGVYTIALNPRPGVTYRLHGSILGGAVVGTTTVPALAITAPGAGDTLRASRLSRNFYGLVKLPLALTATGADGYGVTSSQVVEGQEGYLISSFNDVVSVIYQGQAALPVHADIVAYDSNAAAFYGVIQVDEPGGPLLGGRIVGTITGAPGLFGSKVSARLDVVIVP